MPTVPTGLFCLFVFVFLFCFLLYKALYKHPTEIMGVLNEVISNQSFSFSGPLIHKLTQSITQCWRECVGGDTQVLILVKRYSRPRVVK